MSAVPETTNLSELRDQRADVHAALVAVEAAIAGPLAASDWATTVHDAMVELAGTFERHLAVTEGRDGLFDDVLRVSPRMAGAVRRLRADHVTIRQAIADALVQVRELSRAEDGNAERLRELLLDIVTELARHRQAGADLVYEAFTVDIGGSE